MNDGFQWWLVIIGIGLGAGLLWLVMGRLSRQEDDIGPRERAAESIWISHTIEAGGGIAPVALVEESSSCTPSTWRGHRRSSSPAVIRSPSPRSNQRHRHPRSRRTPGRPM